MYVTSGTWSEPANREGRPRRSRGGQPYPLSRLRGRASKRRAAHRRAMPTHVTFSPLHEGKHEHDASDLSGALDAVAPDWRDTSPR